MILTRTKIKDQDWKGKTKRGLKDKVIDQIMRLNRISKYPDFDINTNFDQGGDSILEIVALIKENSFCFDPIEDITRFRKIVAMFLANGVKLGLETETENGCERFVHSIKEKLNFAPVEHPITADVYFNRFQTETIISVSGSETSELNCECITVEL